MSSPLYDLMRSVVKKPSDHPTPESLILDDAFLNAEVFVSTNVTEYYFAGTDQEYWHIDKHFPNLAPVFDSFWIETKAPTHINSATYGFQPWTLNDSRFYQRPKRWAAWFINVSSAHMQNYWESYIQEHQTVSLDVPIDQCWMYAVTLFGQDDNERLLDPMWTFSMLIDKNTGRAVRNTAQKESFAFLSYPTGKMNEELKTLQRLYGKEPIIHTQDSKISVTLFQMFESEAVNLLKPLLLALSFMHCKNVARIPVHPSAPLNKKRMSRNLPPMHKFHLLEITPMKLIIQQAIDHYHGKKTDIEMAMHHVRGHFKTYDQKPLMGHHVGTWFWAETTKGSKKRGTISKQYEIKT